MNELSRKQKEFNAEEDSQKHSEIISELKEHIYYKCQTEKKYDAISIRDAYGDSIANTIEDIVEGPEKEIQKLWYKYRNYILVDDPHYDGWEAFYDPDTKAITININDCRRGNNYESPYQVAFHEFGHNIDFRINEKINGDISKGYSETYKDGLLGKTAKSEAATFIEDYRLQMEQDLGHSVSTKEACEKISEELMEKIPLMERGDLSDIFEGATNGEINLSIGHGKEYWKKYDNGIEIFAEMFSASICNKGSLNTIKEYFPETYKIFQEIVRSSNE